MIRRSSSLDRLAPPPLTAAERAYIRRELDISFPSPPSIAEGFQLSVRRCGPQAGEPKIPRAAVTLLERGLMRLDTAGQQPLLFFTASGLAALQTMMADGRQAKPAKFARVRRELGIEPAPERARG